MSLLIDSIFLFQMIQRKQIHYQMKLHTIATKITATALHHLGCLIRFLLILTVVKTPHSALQWNRLILVLIPKSGLWTSYQNNFLGLIGMEWGAVYHQHCSRLTPGSALWSLVARLRGQHRVLDIKSRSDACKDTSTLHIVLSLLVPQNNSLYNRDEISKLKTKQNFQRNGMFLPHNLITNYLAYFHFILIFFKKE